jgi:hypothetical protein
MTALELAIAHAVKVLIVVTLAGLAYRRRYRVAWTFAAYLVLILLFNVLMSVWPERFYKQSFWMLAQAVWDIAKISVGLELAYRAFRAFPGAKTLARPVVFVILALTTLALIRFPPTSGSTAESFLIVLTDWHPRVLSGTIWLLTATMFLVVWFHLPIHPFQRAILLGFTPYLLVFTTLLNILHSRGLSIRGEVNLADGLAYSAVVAWWAYAAWRPAQQFVVAPDVIRRLQLEQA